MTALPARPSSSRTLPVAGSLAPMFVSSLAVATFSAVASAVGLLNQAVAYPTEELRQAFLANDIVNLAVGLPILLVAMWLAWRGSLVGLLLWPGALFYAFYNALVYVFALPANASFILNLVVTTTSAYAMAGLLAGIDGGHVRRRLAGKVPERLSAVILVLFGLFFGVRVLAMLVDAAAYGTPVNITERALHVADLAIAPALILCGTFLWRRQAFGYVTGLGLLFQASMLFVGLIVVLILQPVLTSAPFSLVDVVIVAVMGLVCFVPLALFVHGAWKCEV